MNKIYINNIPSIISEINKLANNKEWNKLRNYYLHIKAIYNLPDFILLCQANDIFEDYKKNKLLHKLIGFDDSNLDINNYRILLGFKRYYPEFINLYNM